MMEKFNPWRVIAASAIAIPGCAAVVLVMFLLPKPFAFGGVLLGVACFKIGHGMEYKWCAACGGVLMFGSVFAWAIRQ